MNKKQVIGVLCIVKVNPLSSKCLYQAHLSFLTATVFDPSTDTAVEFLVFFWQDKIFFY